MPCISLTTDFGLSDEYVGVMKGTILSVNPNATMIDITHQVDPQDVLQAAGLIRSAYRYFPAGTVHLVVVDPGVGTGRPILAAEGGGHRFVAPDNGILAPLRQDGVIQNLHRVENGDYFLHPVSSTFHGRDIFAPVAAHLSAGLSPAALGPAIPSAEMAGLDLPTPTSSASGDLVGAVLFIDHFGNLITNIDTEHLEKWRNSARREKLMIKIGNHRIQGLSPSYESAGFQKPLAIIGSRGYLEIAVNRGNARQVLGAGKRDRVRISKTE
ncbi:MAG: SAM hydrolase/SAM-dependent halogenase family protein [Thermodesulfobacteriota bacterium]